VLCRLYFFSFMVSAQTPGAEIEPFFLAVHGNGNRVDIGYEAAVGAAFRMAYIMSELGRFPAKITLQFSSPSTPLRAIP
jgi:hypothetical protein